ncbi:MAG: thioredoxin family protein [Deltaproteobacteria bacterium]|nr:thioredoxin family protein [Deltaproteobacteria bacterium]
MLALSVLLVLPLSSAVPWIRDDWSRAKEEALRQKKLVGVEVWATWSQTCLSMRVNVLKTPAFEAIAPKLVWLSVEHDSPRNEEFLAKFPISAFPTYLVIDPETDTAVARWVGAGTIEQTTRAFATAERHTADVMILGQQALAREDHAEAIRLLSAALPRERKNPRRTLVLGEYIEALWKTNPRACAELGLRHLLETDHTPPGIDFVGIASYCAASLDAPRTRKLREAVVTRLEAALMLERSPLTVDDLSSVLEVLTDTADALGETKKAEEYAKRRAAILEAARAEAKDFEAKAIYVADLVDVLLRLKRFSDAERVLVEAEAAAPDDFNNPYRLAVVLQQAGRFDDALTAIDRGLAKSYGPRRLKLLSTQIDLLTSKQKKKEAQELLDRTKAEAARFNPRLLPVNWARRVEEQERELAP